jgi:hypothetical protein
MTRRRSPPSRSPAEGGRIWNFIYKIIGPPTVANPLQGSSPEAREQWKKYLDARKRHSREQRAKKRSTDNDS